MAPFILIERSRFVTVVRVGLYTLPLCESVRRQRVQMLTRRICPSIITRLRWMLGRNERLLDFLEWLTELPNLGPLPQISHFAIIFTSFFIIVTKDIIP